MKAVHSGGCGWEAAVRRVSWARSEDRLLIADLVGGRERYAGIFCAVAGLAVATTFAATLAFSYYGDGVTRPIALAILLLGLESLLNPFFRLIVWLFFIPLRDSVKRWT